MAAAAAAENGVGTLTEPLRMSERNVHRPNYAELDGGREDDSKSDSDDESRATRCCMVSTDKGNKPGGCVFVKPPRRMRRKATAMSSRSDVTTSMTRLKVRNAELRRRRRWRRRWRRPARAPAYVEAQCASTKLC